jgi:hypothetical protein
VSFVKPTVKSGSSEFIKNLFCNFWTFLLVSTNFGSLNYFLLFKTIGKTINKGHTVPGLKPAHGLRRAGENGPLWRHGGLPRAAGRQAGWALAWRPATRGNGVHVVRSRRGHRAQLARADAVMRSTTAR